jgi:LruC domain-containing protein
VLVAAATVFSSCDSQVVAPEKTAVAGIQELSVPEGFDFGTTRDIAIDIRALDNTGKPMRGVPFDAFVVYPEGESRIFSGATDDFGRLATSTSIPAHVEEIVVTTSYVGLISRRSSAVASHLSFVFGGDSSHQAAQAASLSVPPPSGKAVPYTYLGSWSSSGVPDYLEAERDVIDQGLLDVVNASLPEQYPVPDYHPDYLATGSSTNVVLSDSADVWVTFVHEGAGWTNSLGFFTYDLASPPQSVDDIATHTIIFPNVSYGGSGGGLTSGDRVRIGRFGPNTAIGWFLVAQGWNGSGVGDGAYIHYSNANLNIEADPALQQHNVLLFDEQRDLLLLGFEDVRRDAASCDQDFNDAIFYVTANPVEAVVVENVAPTDDGLDTDGDGISDIFDRYPTDSDRAFNYVYPSEGTFGSLAFEDLWPGMGDYDMNDLVVDYSFTVVTNPANDAVQMYGTFVFRAIGASYKNGLGFELPVPSSSVSTVTGSYMTTGGISLSANGTESGQPLAVIFVTDNASSVLEPGHFVNTDPAGASTEPDTIRVSVQFATPVDMYDLGAAPYNPFVVRDGDRGYEIHLPDKSPTALANTAIFGTGADASGDNGRYYVTRNGLPWAIHIPSSFAYPIERVDITFAHLRFSEWANSAGAVYGDWYLDLSGYRSRSVIFSAP